MTDGSITIHVDTSALVEAAQRVRESVRSVLGDDAAEAIPEEE